MRAARSEFMFRPLPRFENDVAGGGLRAALTLPSGVDDEVMPAVMAEVADIERGDIVGGARGASVDGGEFMLVGCCGGSGGSKGSVMARSVVDEAEQVKEVEEAAKRGGGAGRQERDRLKA